METYVKNLEDMITIEGSTIDKNIFNREDENEKTKLLIEYNTCLTELINEIEKGNETITNHKNIWMNDDPEANTTSAIVTANKPAQTMEDEEMHLDISRTTAIATNTDSNGFTIVEHRKKLNHNTSSTT